MKILPSSGLWTNQALDDTLRSRFRGSRIQTLTMVDRTALTQAGFWTLEVSTESCERILIRADLSPPVRVKRLASPVDS